MRASFNFFIVKDNFAFILARFFNRTHFPTIVPNFSFFREAKKGTFAKLLPLYRQKRATVSKTSKLPQRFISDLRTNRKLEAKAAINHAKTRSIPLEIVNIKFFQSDKSLWRQPFRTGCHWRAISIKVGHTRQYENSR